MIDKTSMRIVIALLVMLTALSPGQAQEPAAAKSAARDLMQRKLYADAARILLDEVKTVPEDQGGLHFLMLAECYYMQLQYAEARPWYAKANRFMPEEERDNRIVAEYRLACVAHRMNDTVAALKQTEAFLRKYPADRRGGGLLLFKMNTLARRGAEAESELESTREFIGKHIRRYGAATDIAADNILTEFYLAQGGSDKARDRYRNIVMNFHDVTREFVESHRPIPPALLRGHDKAAIQLASMSLKDRDYGDAIRWLNIVRHDEEMKRRARLMLAQVAYEQKDFRRAERYLLGDDFIQTIPPGALRSDMYLLLGFCSKRAVHPSLAKVAEYFSRVEPGTKPYAQAQMGLGDTYERWRKYEKAIAAYENAKASVKYEPSALGMLGKVYMLSAEKAGSEAAKSALYTKAAARFETLTTKYPNSREAKNANPSIQSLIEKGYHVKLAVTDSQVAATWESTAQKAPGSAGAARALINLARLHHKVIISPTSTEVTKLPDYAACAHAADRLLNASQYKGDDLGADLWATMKAEALYYRGYAHMASATRSVPPGKAAGPPKYVASPDMNKAMADLRKAKDMVDSKQLDLVKNIELGLLEAMFKAGSEALREEARKRFSELGEIYGGEDRFQKLAYDLAKWFQDNQQFAEAAREYRGIADRNQNLSQDDTLQLLYLAGQLHSRAASDAVTEKDASRFAVSIHRKPVFKTVGLIESHKPMALQVTLDWPSGASEIPAEQAIRLISQASRIPFVWSDAGGQDSVAAYLKRKKVSFDSYTDTVKAFLKGILDTEHHELGFDIGLTDATPTVSPRPEDREDPELIDVVKVLEIVDRRHAALRYKPLKQPYGSWASVHKEDAMLFHVIEHLEEATGVSILWAPGVSKEDVLATEFPSAPAVAGGAGASCGAMLESLLMPLDLRFRIIRRDLSSEYFDRAKDDFNEIRRISPKSKYGERSLFTLALNFFHQEDYERMKIVLTEYLKLFDGQNYQNYHDACFWVGWVFEHEKRYRDAARFYNRAAAERLVIQPAGDAVSGCAELKETIGYETAYALEETYTGALTDFDIARDLVDFVELHCGVLLDVDPGLLESNLVFTTDHYDESYVYDILCDVLNDHGLTFRADSVNRKVAEKATFRLARSYQKNGMPRQALASCRVLLDRFPDTERKQDAYKLQLEIYKALKDYRKVLATLDLLRGELEAKGQGYKVDFEIGWVYFDLCRYDDAIKHFKQALVGAKAQREQRNIRDGLARAAFMKGALKVSLGHYRQLVLEETQALRAFVAEMMVWYLERATGEKKSDTMTPAAAKLMQQYEGLEDSQRKRVNPSALAKISWIYYLTGRLDLAQGDTARAMDKFNAAGNSPDDWLAANALYELAKIQAKSEQYRQAVETLEYLLFSTKSAEAEVKTSILLGECYVAMGRREHALKRYQHVIQRFPDSPHAKQAQEAMEKLKGAETDDPVSGAES
jgi:tetratricopeptide (TPR) repeat protein